MKKIVAAFAVGALILTPGVASATTDICDGQLNQSEASFGFHPGEKSIPGCEEGSGPDAANNALTPDASPHPDARPPLEPVGNVDTGSYDDRLDIHDEDGIQGHDNVIQSPVFVPGTVSGH